MFWLFGAAGPDKLFGGPDNDFLYGQASNDILSGGLGVNSEDEVIFSHRKDGSVSVSTQLESRYEIIATIEQTDSDNFTDDINYLDDGLFG